MLRLRSKQYPANLISYIVQKHLRVTTKDGELYDYAILCVKNAISAAEEYTNRCICQVDSRYECVSDGSREIELPIAPYRELSVVFVDGVDHTDDAELYSTDKRAYVILPDAPAVGAKVGVAGLVGYRDIDVKGIGNTGEVELPYRIPGAIIQAIMLMAGTFFENSADVVGGSVNELPMSAKSLLNPYRIYPYGEL